MYRRGGISDAGHIVIRGPEDLHAHRQVIRYGRPARGSVPVKSLSVAGVRARSAIADVITINEY